MGGTLFQKHLVHFSTFAWTMTLNAIALAFALELTTVLHADLPSPAGASLTPSPAGSGNIIIKDGDTIGFLGDSITAHGWEHSYGYVHLVVLGLAAQGIKVEAIPAGVSGQDAQGMLARVQKDIIEKKPALMTLSCGVNDVMHVERKIELETYQKNITAIVDQVTAAKIKLVIFTSTMIRDDAALNQKLATFNDFLRTLARERNVPLADLSRDEHALINVLAPKEGDRGVSRLTVDGVHMKPIGDQMMATGVLKAFGFNEAQLQKARDAWNATAFKEFGHGEAKFMADVPLTFAQSQAVQGLAAAQQQTPEVFLNDLYTKALVKVVKSNSADISDPVAFQGAVQKQYAADLAEVLKKSPLPSPVP
jgi:lysophospholipase L1-like esterase